MGTSAAWTAARRARQAQLIRRWKPWRSSTGPRSKLGKATSSRNAQAFRLNPEMRAAYLLVQQFLRSGVMTRELGEHMLKSSMSWQVAEDYLPDDDYSLDDEEGGPHSGDHETS